MKKTKRVILGLAVCAFLAGCSADQPDAVEEDVAAENEGVFDPMVGTLDRAEAVDDLSSNRMDQLNQQLEENEE
jgi:PBP1b-binding outer membrane lipoprotein LpoB